ncbi:Uncharacterised protein [Porphyromonas macacae]|uniref:DUF4476 domain-containing protein n=1 Tax=Porphyromonas macacae TaxID=28115 RepID=A0A379E5P0_9PORP|nr:DUF4476 domain-containing protein [Porphyromonas macacae]SUB88028.1 Uncharacterised protein [Porphyromonas macacae]
MKRIILLCTLVVSAVVHLGAQNRISGLSVFSNRQPIIVFINDVQVCEPTLSCFIANLENDSYRVRVMALSSGRNGMFSPVFESFVFYSGFGVKQIDVTPYIPHENIPNPPYEPPYPPNRGGGYDTGWQNSRGYRLQPMPAETYANLKNKIAECTFESDYERAFDLMVPAYGITASQFRELLSMPSFDDRRKVIARHLVPQIIDIENCNLSKVCDFSFTEKEIHKQLKAELESRKNRNR